MIDGKIHGTDCFEVDSVSLKSFLTLFKFTKLEHFRLLHGMILSQIKINSAKFRRSLKIACL